jgi:hypothetical protein
MIANVQSFTILAITEFEKITINWGKNHKCSYICGLLFVEVAFSCVVWYFIKSAVVLLTNGKLPLNGTLFFCAVFFKLSKMRSLEVYSGSAFTSAQFNSIFFLDSLNRDFLFYYPIAYEVSIGLPLF